MFRVLLVAGAIAVVVTSAGSSRVYLNLGAHYSVIVTAVSRRTGPRRSSRACPRGMVHPRGSLGATGGRGVSGRWVRHRSNTFGVIGVVSLVAAALTGVLTASAGGSVSTLDRIGPSLLPPFLGMAFYFVGWGRAQPQ